MFTWNVVSLTMFVICLISDPTYTKSPTAKVAVVDDVTTLLPLATLDVSAADAAFCAAEETSTNSFSCVSFSDTSATP